VRRADTREEALRQESPPWMCVTTTKRCATRECHLGGREGGSEGRRRSQASQATN